jgi:ribosome maturation factor RimP
LAESGATAGPALAKTSEGKAAEVERLIAPAVAGMGYEIVRILLSGGGRPRLQVMAERHDGEGMLLDDCVAISRAIEAILDVEDPIAGSYDLEVSSPGIDRPLTRLADFERFVGFEAKIELSLPVEGRRRWRGRILGVEGEAVCLAAQEPEGEARLPFAAIAKAKLVMTDELIAAAQGARDHAK